MQASRAFWHTTTETDKEVARLMTFEADRMNREELLQVIKELDRRFIQLWDKVQYENNNGRHPHP